MFQSLGKKDIKVREDTSMKPEVKEKNLKMGCEQKS
jgi:hypothetical protein